MTNGKPLPQSSRRYRFSYQKLEFRHQIITEVIIMNEKLNYKLISGIVTSLLYSGFVIMLYVGASFQMYIVANEKIRRVSKIRRLYE